MAVPSLLGKWWTGRKRLNVLVLLLLCAYSVMWVLISGWHLSDGSGRHGVEMPFLDGFLFHQDNSKKSQEFAACLLVMDDSHFLMEWLAYHYHALNLRRLIIVADPNSQTSPQFVLDRWKDYMDITRWDDADYATTEEYQDALREVKQYFGPTVSQSLARHRARQRLFYYKCLQTLKRQGQHWTLLTDTDEFVTLNYPIARAYNLTDHLEPPDQPGAVAQFVLEHARVMGPPTTTTTRQASLVQPNSELLKDNPPLYILQSSPCVQIPRIRFGAQESSSQEVQHHVPTGYNGSNFVTLRFRYHTQPQDYHINKISKTMLDLSRIDLDEIIPVNSIHLPIRSLCQQRRLHLRTSQSLLVLHHYLGSLEQYLYRENDARIEDQVRSLSQFQQQSAGASQQNDDDQIRPWLEGFVAHPPEPLPGSSSTTSVKTNPVQRRKPEQLLQGVGQLQPKSWTTFAGNPNQDRCAMCFFGLPRAFSTMVLPTIIQNVLIPNARHNCDVYVHFYQQFQEAAGRKNRGGKVDPTEIYQLKEAVLQVQRDHAPPPGARTHRTPTVSFTFDTEADFWKRRGVVIAKYQNTTNSDGRPMYFPFNAHTYEKSSIDNIVRQWHSIEFSFKLMEVTARQQGFQYSRVAMFRSDVVYMTPIDIALMDLGITDSRNNHVVVPGFAQMPVNDRMIYGAYQGVKIWATQRFNLVEQRAIENPEPGYVMHSERFLNGTVFPAIEAAGYNINVNYDICFMRARADESAMISDCTMSGATRGWEDVRPMVLLQNLIQRKCTRFKMGVMWTFAGCGEGIDYESSRH